MKALRTAWKAMEKEGNGEEERKMEIGRDFEEEE